MDAYTLHLLGMAVEACGIDGIDVAPTGKGWRVCIWEEPGSLYKHHAWSPTLADALAALLRDLGVEVPERPAAERVADLEAAASGYRDPIRSLRSAFASDRLAVLALLEEGS